MGAVIGIDAGNSKTELVAASFAGVPSMYLRGPGMNLHGVGAEGCIAALRRLVERSHLELPVDYGVFDEVVARLARRAPGARPVAATDPPVVGAALVALEAAGASAEATHTLRAAFRDGPAPDEVVAG